MAPEVGQTSMGDAAKLLRPQLSHNWKRGVPVYLRVAVVVVVAVLAAAGVADSAPSVNGCIPRWRMFAFRHVPALSGVVALSPSDVWASGNSEGASARSTPELVHWDGRSLATIRFAWKGSSFAAVSASSSSDVWAVGGSGHQPLAVHWDGYRARRVALPRLRGGGSFADVAAIRPDDAWAVGDVGGTKRPLVMHWNGRRWRSLDLRGKLPTGTELKAVDANGPDDVWAAGLDTEHAPVSYGWTDLVIHWDGHEWRRIESPLANEASGPYAYALDIGMTGEVWTANVDLSGNGPWFVRWSGTSRRVTSVYSWDGALRTIYDIADISGSNLWAVGDIDYRQVHGRTQDALTPFVEHWDGKVWTHVPTPFEKFRNLPLYGVSADAPGDLWAVGNHVIVRYSC